MAQKNTVFESLSRGWGGSCVIRPDYTPSHLAPGCGLGNRATQLWHSSVGIPCSFLFLPVDTPPLGFGGDLGISAAPTVAQDRVTSCFIFFGGITSPRPPSIRSWRYFGVPLFRPHILAPPPFRFSWRSLSASYPRRSEVWEWVLKSGIFDSCSSSWNRASIIFQCFCIYRSSEWASVMVLP